MENVNIFKKLLLFIEYFKILKRNRKKIIDSDLNLKIDRVGRIYTVYTCPEETKRYGREMAEKHIREYVSKVDKLFIDIGLTEYVGVRVISQLIEEYTELDFLIVFGYTGFDNVKFFRNLIIFSLGIIGTITYILISS